MFDDSSQPSALTVQVDFDRQNELLQAASRAVGFLSAVRLSDDSDAAAARIAESLRAAINAALETQRVAS